MIKKAFSLLALFVTGLAGYFAYVHFSDRGRLTTEPVFTGLERLVSNNTLISPRGPEASLQFDPSFRYLGGQRFVLYGVADTEQYFFAEADQDDKLTGLYWIQFEEYLPSNSYQYDYDDSAAHVEIGGYDFYLDTAAVKSNPRNRRQGSDGSMARQFLQSKGYAIPDEYFYARLVHLTDSSQRKELMIIFISGEGLGGYAPADLEEGGKDARAWPDIEKTQLERIRETLTLHGHAAS